MFDRPQQTDRFDYLETKTKRLVRALESFPAEGIDKDVVNYILYLLNLMRSWFRAKQYGYEDEALGVAGKLARGSKELREKVKLARESQPKENE